MGGRQEKKGGCHYFGADGQYRDMISIRQSRVNPLRPGGFVKCVPAAEFLIPIRSRGETNSGTRVEMIAVPFISIVDLIPRSANYPRSGVRFFFGGRLKPSTPRFNYNRPPRDDNVIQLHLERIFRRYSREKRSTVITTRGES